MKHLRLSGSKLYNERSFMHTTQEKNNIQLIFIKFYKIEDCVPMDTHPSVG